MKTIYFKKKNLGISWIYGRTVTNFQREVVFTYRFSNSNETYNMVSYVCNHKVKSSGVPKKLNLLISKEFVYHFIVFLFFY